MDPTLVDRHHQPTCPEGGECRKKDQERPKTQEHGGLDRVFAVHKLIKNEKDRPEEEEYPSDGESKFL
jgi:hypothetical protein